MNLLAKQQVCVSSSYSEGDMELEIEGCACDLKGTVQSVICCLSTSKCHALKEKGSVPHPCI